MPNVKSNHTRPDMSIVIVSFNTKRITVDCLSSIYESLQGSNLGVEVLVVDNDSKDGSVEEIKRLQKTYPSIHLIESKENLGFGKANNLAVTKAQSEVILFLNSDIIVLEKALEKLYTFYRENETAYQFAGGKLLNADMSPQASSGRFFTVPVTFAFLFLQGDKLGLTRNSPDETVSTDWVSGACIITKKNYYEKLNGFDEGIFMYMEEVDLLYRAHKHGMQTGFYPDARFIHLGSASSGKTYPVLQAFRGLLYFYKKHYGRVEQSLLKCMLQLKALLAYGVGLVTGNNYLKTTYGEAIRITQMDR